MKAHLHINKELVGCFIKRTLDAAKHYWNMSVTNPKWKWTYAALGITVPIMLFDSNSKEGSMPYCKISPNTWMTFHFWVIFKHIGAKHLQDFVNTLYLDSVDLYLFKQTIPLLLFQIIWVTDHFTSCNSLSFHTYAQVHSERKKECTVM